MSVKCNHEGLVKWVEEMAAMCKPDQIYWCDGSKEEFDRMMSLMVENGSAIPLKIPLPVQPQRRRQDREPHLPQYRLRGRRGPDQ
jgi:GTP-dependent phosphoenolpyruvate carboxykinase